MYNNPYLYNNYFPYQNLSNNILGRRGFFSSLFNGQKINWGNLLNNTQKTLNVINQAIPVYYQVKPIYNNAKTMFRMLGALKSDDSKSPPVNDTTPINEKNTSSGPVFFI